MSDRPGAAFGRTIVIIVLMFAALGFGAMSLCGGVLMLSSVPLLFTSGWGTLDLLGMSLPFALGGFFMARLCVKKLNALLSRRPSKKEPS